MTASLPTKEELELIRDYVLLPIMLDVVKSDRDKMKYEFLSLKELYLKADDALLNILMKDLFAVKQELKRLGIKVEEIDRTPTALNYKFWYKGYEDHFSLMRMVVKSEISVRLGRYINRMFEGR
ncbi:hypothetical protein [Paenibacillus sp. NEAU-GSW1]|uniref:hypothetical protein n=1 Tax=Paenibacillus sp. NEAU-GSW1 TaxID=2682486 RepID=UPI0012E321E8|nr:hypothetical protein [Paenibacillus sp. NEAU-GSW1]MUT66000.1 hypothetical protein [Paenibacillus sp. NEAU-GSW1]